VHGRLVVHWSPGDALVYGLWDFAQGDVLEEEDVWFWLVNFVVLPAQTLSSYQHGHSNLNRLPYLRDAQRPPLLLP
jgi:hypothetical protein